MNNKNARYTYTACADKLKTGCFKNAVGSRTRFVVEYTNKKILNTLSKVTATVPLNVTNLTFTVHAKDKMQFYNNTTKQIYNSSPKNSDK